MVLRFWWSGFWWSGFGFVVEQLFEAVEAVMPDRFELVEQTLRPTHGVDVAPHELLAAAPLLDDEVGAFEYRDVFLDGREGHVVTPSEC